MECIFNQKARRQGPGSGWQVVQQKKRWGPWREAERGVNDLSACKVHGSGGSETKESGKTPLTPWQSLPQVVSFICPFFLSLFFVLFPALGVCQLAVCHHPSLLLRIPVFLLGSFYSSIAVFLLNGSFFSFSLYLPHLCFSSFSPESTVPLNIFQSDFCWSSFC